MTSYHHKHNNLLIILITVYIGTILLFSVIHFYKPLFLYLVTLYHPKAAMIYR